VFFYGTISAIRICMCVSASLAILAVHLSLPVRRLSPCQHS
jgi:hypothetical protein